MSRPRIRTLKPDNWADENVGALSRDARLLRDVLITFADDDGRWRQLPAAIIGHGYPYDDDVTPAKVRKWTSELVAVGIVIVYQVDGIEYGCFPRWHGHQRINRYLPSKLPGCPDQRVIQRDGPPTPHAQLTDNSVSPHPLKGVGSKEGKNSTVAASGDRAQIDAIWTAYVETRHQVLGARSTPQFTKDRRALIARRLKDWPAQDLVDAVRGWQHFAHNRGENDRSTPYCDLELVIKDAAHIERFRDKQRGTSSESLHDLAARANAAHGAAA